MVNGAPRAPFSFSPRCATIGGMTTQTSIRITVNGVGRETPRGSSVLDLVKGLGAGGPGTAVALNDTIVRRDDYSNVILSPGDRIEVIQAVGGG